MAISWGIEDSEILGPPYRKGKEEGKKGEEVVRRQIERRFGPLPSWAEDRLNGICIKSARRRTQLARLPDDFSCRRAPVRCSGRGA